MKTYIMADIESNGPIPGDYSMTSLGAVIVDGKLDKTFKINIKPISKKFDPSRRQFIDEKDAVDAKEAMQKFKEWILKNSSGTPVFISDNNGFDWMFICWYFWHFLGENPFGYNSQNLNSLNKGLNKNLYAKLDSLRERNLIHDALEDAKDNAKIFHELRKKFFKKNV
jgi:hypothetical protein